MLDVDLLDQVVNSILLLKAAIIKSQMHLVQLFHQGICPFLSYNFIVLCIFDKKMFLIQVALEWFKTLDKATSTVFLVITIHISTTCGLVDITHNCSFSN